MPDINLLKNTEKYDPANPKPLPPTGPGPLSDPSLEAKGFGGALRSFFSRRPKIVEPSTPTLGKATSGAGRMSLGRSTAGERILNEKKSKPTMIQLPEEEESGFSVNLLGQDIGQVITLRRQAMKLAMVAIGSIVFVGLVYIGLTFFQTTLTTDIDEKKQQITSLQSEIKQLEETQAGVAATTKKITAIRSLIDRHVHWSKFFAELEKITTADVFYGTSFTGDLSGGVTLAARTTSFDNVATQYLLYQQAVNRGDFLRSFEITGASKKDSKTGPEVSFTVSLEVAPDTFYKTVEDLTAAPATPTPVTEPVTGSNSNTNSASPSL